MKKFFQTLSILAILLFTTNGAKAQCVPNFTFTVGSGGTVTFTSTSIGTTTKTIYYWSFGNNTYTTGLNHLTVSATYTTNAAYQVNLSISDTLNSCYGTFGDTIQVNTAGCNDNVTINHQQQPNGVVNFQGSLSTPAVVSGSSWTFGDGGTSTNIYPSHTYTASGMYLITLSTTVGICTYSTTKNVSVTVANCNINASYTYSLSSNGVAHFFSTTTGAGVNATYYWYFGDGQTGTGTSITHTYNMNAQYHAILLVNDSTAMFGCHDSTMHAINITNAPCFNNTSFFVTKDTNMVLTWNAMPSYPGNVNAASWSWGDGSSTVGFYPSHTYSAAGVYSICLSTTLSCGSPTTVCWMGNIYKPSGQNGENGAMVTLNVLNPNNAVGIKQNAPTATTFKYYPSPVSDVLTLELGNAGTHVSIRILDAVGKTIRNEKVSANDTGKINLNVSELATGLYYLQVDNNGTTQNAKLIKQ